MSKIFNKILLVFTTFVVVFLITVPAFADGTDMSSSAVINDYDDSLITYSDESRTDGTIDDTVRDERGQVSWLNTESRNPYHNLITIRIDLGSEFADFAGSEWSEGFIVKCRPGDIIKLPVVRAKPGYTFVGWSQGGVPDEIEMGIGIEEIEMADDAENGKQTALYAVYMDEAGNGICTCGAFTKDAYVDKMDEFKELYSYYLADRRGKGADAPSIREQLGLGAFIVLGGLGIVYGIYITLRLRNRQRNVKSVGDLVEETDSSLY